MATYYVGPGGNDANDGLSWANRFLTLNGAEDEPVAAGDIVYVGPGVYRELLTCDVSGGGGNPITYIGDVTGENTDGVGGIVRITGSDNDQTAARVNVVSGAGIDYRTFQGFWLDISSGYCVNLSASSDNWIIQDCIFYAVGDSVVRMNGTATNNTIRRCLFYGIDAGTACIELSNGAFVNDTTHVFSNLMLIDSSYGLYTARVDGFTIKNCSFIGRLTYGVFIGVALDVGKNINVNNCIFEGLFTALSATAVGEIVEDYNTFYGNSTDRANTNTGANSVAYPSLRLPPLLLSGIKFPWWFGELSEWSPIRAIVGSNEPAEDLHGIVRPTTAAKNSWGAVQFHDSERETGTTRASSTASLVLHDAGVLQMWVPVTAIATTFSVYVYREANYAGVNPSMVVKQPGQADDTTVDVGAAGAWNRLATTITPAADPPYVVVELQSLNTAVAGNYDVFFDDLRAE